MFRIASKFIHTGKQDGCKILALTLSLLIFTGGCSVQSGPKSNESSKNEATGPGTASTAEQNKDPAEAYYIGKEVDCLEAKEGEQLTVAGAAVSGENTAVLFSVGVVDPDSEYGELMYSSSLWVYGKDGTVILREDMILPANGSALTGLAMTTNPKGGFSGLFMTESKRYMLFNFDESGQSTGDPISLPGIDTIYPALDMQYDTDGNINIATMGQFRIFSPEGKNLLKIDDKSIDGQLYLFGGKAYVSGYVATGASTWTGAIFAVDTASGSLGEALEGGESLERQIYSASGVLYGSDTDSFYRVDAVTLKKDPAFYWNRTDLVIGYTEREVYPVGDTAYFCIQCEYNTGKLTFTILNKAPDDYMNGKTVLTIAGVSIAYNPAVQKAMIAFNRENPEYRIEIIDYMQRYGQEYTENPEDYQKACDAMMQRIRMEIMSGNGPDMLLYTGDENLSLMNYTSSGLLVDLVPLMNGDSDLREEDYVSSILNATKQDGKLYQFPLAFYFSGLFAPEDRIPDVTGWTPDSFLAFAKGLPEGTAPFERSFMHSDLLKEILPYSESSFVDSETSQVQFDSPDFIKMLDIVKAYSTPDVDPNDLSAAPYNGDIIEAFVSGEYCFYNMRGVADPWDYAACDNLCGKSGCVFTGYPSTSGAGPIGHLTVSIGIVDKSDVSAGCWAFLKSLLSDENQRNLTATMDGDSFRLNPILSPLLDEYIETSMKEIPPGQTVDYFDKDAKPVTEEQAKEYRELIDGITQISQNDKDISDIVLEEAAAYFMGQKTSDEVVQLIQNRVQTLVYERG